ncbi:uncharacterized protein FIBRA_08803 [Fibroporia radiculosa]|uniref:GTP binding protein 2 n=1 Tax=Fibroporia radiculosa TaxID=599839 RepID=J4GXF8_9APHY|nr:uncharacterized protein FIBRA_08803 [Fibroporia radiculosa]CCM06530.1 predicted protein [Fibroporia radiculosa]
MFGGRKAESPRVPSPWDPFLPSPPSEEVCKRSRKGVPKLVPEVEEGNVEYKLRLTHITPARFARLVTQLKWRLLEGGGQAYYELGVADSGALIGLSRDDLEESLETLEMMAGEIGASVIVVKEIEVPPVISAMADEAQKYLDPNTGEWTRKMKRKLVYTGDESSLTTTETETELSTTDWTDNDDGLSSTSGLITPADSLRASPYPVNSRPFAHRVSSNPNRPNVQSSPFIAPLDDDLALFSMEPEPAFPSESEDGGAEDEDASIPSIAINLEIASVYKPRPIRNRGHTVPNSFVNGAIPLYGRHARRQKFREKEKKVQPWHKTAVQIETPSVDAPGTMASIPVKQERARSRQLARDKHREEKRRVFLAKSGSIADGDVLSTTVPSPFTNRPAVGDSGVTDLVSGLGAFHVIVDSTTSTAAAGAYPRGDVAAPVDLAEADAQQEKIDIEDREPRLIVEALVVRKLSIEEACLDFGGFQLVSV